ncbi:MAG: hydrolase [Candidatus Dactylopiibacterium carminicum]|uniref:Hydrolase n=1 Tax=Candidatus Dactylopiibacterium carminicum TaxID=857335 RepID=A0A272ENF1_9RHOO|nr:hydrolase [Candidatus Dactylopiibacterium carminicum]KAF7598069.1 hydrolase [Candidatus Dactylopiibacterium carminicum]PAS91632.1 MAG: hydrolase [Candidatus Dactylopiibacterium carminicum]PAS96511.1 MAG: alpha/beta hydrolase [Candidatus Dactylopiibacterium carminicum]
MKYAAPTWLKGAHAQTIWPLLIKGPLPHFTRKRWKTPDEDFIDLDFLPHREGKPLVVLFHGLEGSSRSHYARALMRLLEDEEWNGVVVHFRGCSGHPNRLPRAYHSGDADEIDWILRRFARKYSGIPRYAVGFSLGANALLCWLGSRRESAKNLLSGAAAVSAPLDLFAAGHHLAQGFNQIYTRHFLSSMRRMAAQKARSFPGRFDALKVSQARTLEDFDEAYTAPLHGFRSAEDYWRRASAKPLLSSIRLPTLVLNARNDPFLPPHALPAQDQVSGYVRLEIPDEGGHVGFVTGTFPGHLDWLPMRLLRFFRKTDSD